MRCPNCKTPNKIGEYCDYCGSRTTYCDICQALIADDYGDGLCFKCKTALNGIIRLKKFKNGKKFLQKCVFLPHGNVLHEIFKILGWQGGTIHQVKEEIKRLRSLQNENKV